MRGGILAVGILLLILGIFLYFTGNNMVNEVEAYNVQGVPISELLKLVSPDIKNTYDTGQQMVMFGSIFGIIGFILCIAGIVAPGKKQPIQTIQPSTVITQQLSNKEILKPNRRCPECGRVIPDDAKMCPYCGKKFKSQFEEEKESYESEDEIDEEKTKGNLKKNTRPPKHCSECGYKFEEEDLDFCPKCGEKLK